MTTRLGLISDIHASPAPLKEALTLFEQQKVDLILCPGDVAGYGDDLETCIDLLIESQCKTIRGNHESWYLEKTENPNDKAYQYISSLPETLELIIESKKVLMVHAEPPAADMGGIRLLNQKGELDDELNQQWAQRLTGCGVDILIVGHTHQVFAEQISNTLVINPGSCAYNHSCAILELPEMNVEFFALSGQALKKTWNWGMEFKN